MKAVVPECCEDRINGMCSRAVKDYQTDYDQTIRILTSNTVNYSLSVLDNSVKANADYGLSV